MTSSILRLALLASIMMPGAAAFSADLDPPPPLLPATYDWTGAFVGVIGSVVSLEGHYDKIPDCVPGDPVCGPVDPEMSGTSYMGGIIGGFNYQINDFVVGIEGDYQWGGEIAQNRDPAELTYMRFNSMATIRGRAGMVFDSTLLYLTAGWGFVDTEFGGQVGDPNGANFDVSDSKWINGVVIGGGMEHAFSSNFHGRLEYLYMDTGGMDYRLEDPNGFGGNVDMHFTGIHSVRAGLTYNFSL
jgi:outer membrane immunogenic protein